MKKPMTTSTIPMDRIVVPEGRRPLNQAKIRELAASIRALGLLSPITVTTDYALVAGWHRLEACRLLGWTEIPAVILPLGIVDAELAQIDENLIRNELSVLERGEHLLRRNDILEGKGLRATVGRPKNRETVSPFAPKTTFDIGPWLTR